MGSKESTPRSSAEGNEEVLYVVKAERSCFTCAVNHESINQLFKSEIYVPIVCSATLVCSARLSGQLELLITLPPGIDPILM